MVAKRHRTRFMNAEIQKILNPYVDIAQMNAWDINAADTMKFLSTSVDIC